MVLKVRNQESAKAAEDSSPGVKNHDQPEITVGEIVLYTTDDTRGGAEAHAAIVAHVYDDGTAQLTCFGPSSEYRLSGIKHSTETPGSAAASGCWAYRPQRMP